jgi:SAM-dependent methyltransferase
MVHVRLWALGWVVGGMDAVVHALRDAVGPAYGRRRGVDDMSNPSTEPVKQSRGMPMRTGHQVEQARDVPPRNLERLSRVYGPTTWDVYERLDVSLDPAGPDSLFDAAAPYVAAGQVVLDAGCRDGAHLIELVRRFAVTGVGVEPVALHVERAEAAVQASGLADRITLYHGVMHELPYPEAYFDFVWCRDVVEQVDDLGGALREVVRVMKPAARLLLYTTVATDLLTAHDAEVMRRHLGNVDGNLDRAALEIAFDRSGFAVESVHVIGTEWREYAEERTQPVSRALLRLARLRRQRDDIVHEHGRDIYEHIEANLHWELFQFLGKLEPLVYVLHAT